MKVRKFTHKVIAVLIRVNQEMKLIAQAVHSVKR